MHRCATPTTRALISVLVLALSMGTATAQESSSPVRALPLAPDNGERWDNARITNSGLPQAKDNGARWDAKDTSPNSLPGPARTGQDFNAFAKTAVDTPTLARVDPQLVTVSSLSATAMRTAAQISRGHTFPGGVDAITSLEHALLSFPQSTRFRGEALMRMVEIFLRLDGDANNATNIATGARILARGETKPAIGYIRGVAADLRAVGAVKGAHYLDNTATLVEEGLAETTAGILDAATLSLRFGATPHPHYAKILSYDPQGITDVQMYGFIDALIRHMAQVIGDPAYAQLAQELKRDTSPDGIARIRAAIAQETQRAEAARAQRQQAAQPAPNSFSTIIEGN